MNEERQARLEERIRGLQRSFLESLPNLMVKIVDYWNTLRHTGWDGIVLMELKAIIHRLAGSGGTFGFPDISRIAATLDAALTNTITVFKDVFLEGYIDDIGKNRGLVDFDFLRIDDRINNSFRSHYMTA